MKLTRIISLMLVLVMLCATLASCNLEEILKFLQTTTPKNPQLQPHLNPKSLPQLRLKRLKILSPILIPIPNLSLSQSLKLSKSPWLKQAIIPLQDT